MAKVSAKGVQTKLSRRLHYHSCVTSDCRRTYSCTCARTDTNARCQLCRQLRRPLWESARDPQPCCVDNCRQVTYPDVLLRYQLAGPGPWFQCQTCARCHGRPPTSTARSSSEQPS